MTSIGDGAFDGCSGFTGDLTIPNSVRYIGVEAFDGCTGFTGALTISNSVTTIGDKAFRECLGFTVDLIIPNSVTSIGSYAFEDCSGFTGDLTISNSVKTIGSYAFYGCSGFTGALTIPNSVTTIGTDAFYGCEEFKSIECSAITPPKAYQSTFSNYNIPLYVPRESVEDYKTADVWEDFFTIEPIGGASSGISSAESGAIEITAIAGGVRITGAAGKELSIYSTSGVMIARELIGSDNSEISLVAGVYIVKVDNTVSKLVVR